MYVTILVFLTSLTVLLFSTQRFLKIAEKIATALSISPLIVGLTIVALGTSLPELAVSTTAVLKNDAGLALGNIVGSNVVNILLVLPISLLIGRLRIGTTKTQRSALLLLFITALFYLTQRYEPANKISSILLLSSAVAITFLEYWYGIKGRNKEDKKELKSLTKERLSTKDAIWGVFLLIGITVSSFLIVNSVEELSLLTGLSTTLLGLTLTAVATSLPELLTTIFSQEEDQEKITIGNIIGSNIYNLTLIGGVTVAFSGKVSIPTKEWLWLLATTLGFVAFLHLYKGRTTPRWLGLLLLLLLFTYLVFQ